MNVASLRESPSYKWYVLAVVECSIILIGIDSTVVNLALPTISKELGATVNIAQWVIAGYFIATAVALPAAGGMADMFGRKRVFVLGFIVFTAASVACGLAPSIEVLILMRVLQALGGAALLANSNAITVAIFPATEHGMAMGVNGTVYSVGYALGYTLGGFLIDLAGWRSVFLVNLPIGIMAVVLGTLVLDEARLTRSGGARGHIDLVGTLLSVIGIGGVMVGVTQGSHDGRLTAEDACLLGVGATALAILVPYELRQSHPMLHLRFFSIWSFTAGIVGRFMNNGIVAACTFLVPFFTQIVFKMSAIEAGLLMLPYSLSLSFVGPMSGRFSDRHGARLVTTAGFVASGLCVFGLSLLSTPNMAARGAGGWWLVVLAMLVLGCASGLFVSPNNSATLHAVPSEESGGASGMLWSSGFLGSAVGTAFSATMLHVGALGNAAGPAQDAAILAAQATVFHVLMAVSVVGGALCLVRGAPSPKR